LRKLRPGPHVPGEKRLKRFNVEVVTTRNERWTKTVSAAGSESAKKMVADEARLEDHIVLLTRVLRSS
jgi:hypothetical protein